MPTDQDDNGIPIGDASHILDNEPRPTVERRPMQVPVSESLVTPDGQPIREPSPQDQTPFAMPGELVRLVEPKELADDAKRMVEPCTSCRFFSFPDPASQDYRMILAMCKSFVSNLPDWMRAQTPGADPDEYGVCQGAPHGRRVAIHILNSCYVFQPRVSG